MFRAKCRVVHFRADCPSLRAKAPDGLKILVAFEIHMAFANVAFHAVRASPDWVSFKADDGD